MSAQGVSKRRWSAAGDVAAPRRGAVPLRAARSAVRVGDPARAQLRAGQPRLLPEGAPRASFIPGWERIWTVLVVNIVCAAICAIGLLASGYSWRRLRANPALAGAISGDSYRSQGTVESFAVSGLMVSGIFTVAILFNTSTFGRFRHARRSSARARSGPCSSR